MIHLQIWIYQWVMSFVWSGQLNQPGNKHHSLLSHTNFLYPPSLLIQNTKEVGGCACATESPSPMSLFAPPPPLGPGYCPEEMSPLVSECTPILYFVSIKWSTPLNLFNFTLESSIFNLLGTARTNEITLWVKQNIETLSLCYHNDRPWSHIFLFTAAAIVLGYRYWIFST